MIIEIKKLTIRALMERSFSRYADCRHIIRNSESAAIFVSDKYQNQIDGLKTSQLHSIISQEDFSVASTKNPITDLPNSVQRFKARCPMSLR